jgi:hypothetical protein
MPSKVPAKFKALTSYFIDQKKKIGEAMHNEVQRPWLDLQELGGSFGNFNIQGLRSNFSREEANNEYMKAKQNKEAVDSDIAAPKLAADFMAVCERDFADMRKRSRIRMMVHAGVRDRLNGDNTIGSLALNTVRFVEAVANVKIVGPSGA